MSKTIRTAMGILAAVGVVLGADIAVAADLAIPAKSAGARSCGRCGCLRVTYVHHRELLTTYGAGFDPRNYDSQEPHHFYGAVRAYPRYWVAADGVD
jgi:hypothetical protein